MYASSFPMNKSFSAWMMWDADTRGLLTSATCHVLLRTNDLLPVIHGVPSSWSFEPFAILGPRRFLSGYFWEPAPRHHVLRRPRVGYLGDFLPRPLSSASVSWDQVIQSSRRLLILVIFGKVVKCFGSSRFLHLVILVPSGPAPLSLVIRCLHTREFFCLLSFVKAVGPLVWTVHSPICPCSPQSQKYRVSLLHLPLPLPLFPVLPLPLSPYQSGLLPLEPFLPPFFPPPPLLATRQFISSFFHDATPLIRLVLSCRFPLPALYTFQAMAHTSSCDMSLLMSESSCVDFVSYPLTFPKPIISLMIISSFSTISSNFLGPVTWLHLSDLQNCGPCRTLRHMASATASPQSSSTHLSFSA